MTLFRLAASAVLLVALAGAWAGHHGAASGDEAVAWQEMDWSGFLRAKHGASRLEDRIAVFVRAIEQRTRWWKAYCINPGPVPAARAAWQFGDEVDSIVGQLAATGDRAARVAAILKFRDAPVPDIEPERSRFLDMALAASGESGLPVRVSMQGILKDPRSDAALMASAIRGCPSQCLVTSLDLLLGHSTHPFSAMRQVPGGPTRMYIAARVYPVREAVQRALTMLGVRVSSERTPDPKSPDTEEARYSHLQLRVDGRSVAEVLRVWIEGRDRELALETVDVAARISLEPVVSMLEALRSTATGSVRARVEEALKRAPAVPGR